MALSSLLPATETTTTKPHHHRRHQQQQQQYQYQYQEEKQIRRKRKKKKQPPTPPPPPPKPPSSWTQFKSLLTCRSVIPSHIYDPSITKLGSSCSSICSFKDVVHSNSRVVHRGDRDQDHSPGSSGHVGPETSLLSTRKHQSSRGVQFRKLSGCYECHAISEPTRYPMPRLICSCPECGEVFTKPESLELHQIVRHGVSELGPEDSGRNIVEIIFKSSWSKKPLHVDETHNVSNPTLFCKIDRILKVHNTQRTISRFEEYRAAVKSRAASLLLHTNAVTAKPKKNPRCAADGNELLRFHCTTLSCSLGARGSTSLCCTNSMAPPCGVCSIIRHGFGRAGQETGKGVRTTASSGRAHHCFMEDGGRRRAMLVCRVIAGRVKRAGEDATLPEEDAVGVGYDSVAGGKQCYGGDVGGSGYGNLEELFVANPRAILPCFVVVYRTFQ